MRKKILSAILALAMVAGMAVPAFAANSDVAGDAKKVTKITATKDVYEIKVGSTVDFSNKIAVYEDNTKLVLDHNHIRYMLNGNTGSGDTGDFRINGSEVTAVKAGAEATLTIFDNYNASTKARVTVKLKAVANSYWKMQSAESFTFAKASNDVIYNSAYGESEGAKIVLNAHPSGTSFLDDEAINAVKDKVLPVIAEKLHFNTTTSEVVGVATKGTEEVAGTAAKIRVALGWTAAAAATEMLQVSINGTVVANVAIDATNTADAPKFATTLKTAIGDTVKVDGKEYTVAVDTNDLTFVSKNTDVVGAPAFNVTLKAVDASALKATPATSYDVLGVAKVDATASKVEFDFTNAVAVAAGAKMQIAGKEMVVSNTTTTVKAQLDAFVAANPTIDGYNASFDATGLKLILTETPAAGAAVAPAMLVTKVNTTSSVAIPAGLTANYADYDDDGYNEVIEIKIGKELLTADAKKNVIGTSYYTYLPVSVEIADKFGPQVGKFTASTNITPVDAIAATSIQIKSAYDVTVGKNVDVEVEFYPTNSNVNRKAILRVESFRNDGKPWQNAVIVDEWKSGVTIKGVNSANKVVVTGNVNGGVRTAFATVTVNPTDFNELTYTSTISAKSKEIKVGEEATIAINNVPAGVTVKWTAAQEEGKEIVSFDAADKAVVKVTGKAVGTVVVTAELSNGEKFTCDIDVAAAPAVEEKPTDVPATGDSFFANLF